MVVFYLRNGKAPDDKVVPLTISLQLVVAPPRDELDKDTGAPIPPEIVNLISEDTVHEELQAAMGRIGSRVEWPALHPDTQPPQLADINPSLNAEDVNIFSNITYRLKEPLPASGLDLATLNMTLNGLPVITSGVAESGENVDFSGNVFDLIVVHRPKRDFG
jgi:hypothetical protein